MYQGPYHYLATNSAAHIGEPSVNLGTKMAQVNEQNGKRDVKIRAALQQLGAAVQSSGTPERLICSRGVGNSISPTDQMPLQAD